MGKRKLKKNGMIIQVLSLFAVSILLTGLISFFSQHAIQNGIVKEQTELFASRVAKETSSAIEEYPASGWLLEYWYEHSDELDIEYDVAYEAGTVTEKKCRLLEERIPGVQLKYVTESEAREMAPENQKLYAEIAYSWLITRLNQIKRSYDISFLFIVVTDETCREQFFLASAAEEGAVRGTEYLQVYPLGVTVEVGESQQKAMQSARTMRSHLADAGDYMDYYASLGETAGRPLFIGMTYDLSVLKEQITVQTLHSSGFAMLYQLALAFVTLLLVIYFVIRPLKAVQKDIRLYKLTKDSRMVTDSLQKLKIRNEIKDLASDVSDLAVSMDAYIAQIGKITAEKERISTELALAARIQEAMLPGIFPPFPNRSEFDIYASMDPAKEVGGDFYDFFLVDEDHLCIVIADVAGKGIPAALFMMVAKTIISNNVKKGDSPAKALMEANENICASNQEEMFVTVWLGILELSTGRLVAANAGHEYPVLKKPGGKYELYKDKHGFVIGGIKGIRIREYELLLEPGSKLFLYTDGVPEATDSSDELFGAARMLAALNADPDGSPSETLKTVRSAVDAFVKEAEQFDDLTMVCLEYKGRSEKEEAGQEIQPGVLGPEDERG